jgi:hypothetical protein
VVAKRSTTEEVNTRVWVGSEDDLRALADVLTGAFADDRDAAAQKLAEERGRYEADQGMSADTVNKLVAISQRSFDVTWGLSASADLRRGKQTLSGSLEDVLHDADLSDCGSFTMRCASGTKPDRSIRVWLSRSMGARCTIMGDDLTWIGGVRYGLTERLRPRMPWWSWMHMGYGMLGAVSIAFVLWLLALPIVSPRGLAEWLAACLGLACAMMLALLTLSFEVMDHLLPRFEVLPPSTRSTGTRRLGWVVGLFVAAAVSLLVGYYFGVAN